MKIVKKQFVSIYLRWTKLWALAAVMISIFPLNAIAQDMADNNATCHPVTGVFLSESVPPSECSSPVGICTKGYLFGGLTGSYEFKINGMSPTLAPEVPFITFFSGRSEITLFCGKTVVGIDSGSLNLSPPGTTGSGIISSLLTIVEGGTGYVHIRGTIDLDTGQARGFYSGMVCTP